MSEATKALRGLGKGGAVPSPAANPAGSGSPEPKVPPKEPSGAQKRKAKREAEAAARQGAGPVPPVGVPPASPPVPAAPAASQEGEPSWASKDTHEKFAWALKADPDALRRFFQSPMGKITSEKIYRFPWAGLAVYTGEPEVVPPEKALEEGAEAIRWCIDVYLPNLRRFGPLIALGSCLVADGVHAYAVLKAKKETEAAPPAEVPTRGRGVEPKEGEKK